MFARPLALGEMIGQLESGECIETDFLPMVSVINMLVDEGALVPADADRGSTRGWAIRSSIHVRREHARMLHDDRRTRDYVTALTEAVRPGTWCSTSAPVMSENGALQQRPTWPTPPVRYVSPPSRGSLER